MKTHLVPSLFVSVMAIIPGTLTAGSPLPDSLSYRSADREAIINSTKVIYVGDSDKPIPANDSVTTLIRQFYEEQYRQFYDPDAPSFMFMTKDADLAMGVGGKVVMRGWFDWNGSQDTPDFFPYDIAVPADPTQKRCLGASMNETSIFMTLLGRKNRFSYTVYVQAAFSDKAFKLKKAYVKLNDFTLGLANTTFEDGDAIAPTVESQGPNGQVGKTQILARYSHSFSNGISTGIGVEFPSSSQDVVDGQTEACRDYVPDVAAMVQYSWNGGDSHIRASGLLRTMAYRNLLTATNHNVIGWGAQLSGVIDIGHPAVVYFSGLIGRGVGSYEGDLSEGNFDLVGVNDSPGRMIAPLAMGLTAGIQYNFSSRVFACVAAGETRYFEKHPIATDTYKYGLYGAVNLFWKITPRFLSGIEYVVGKRKNFDGNHAGANRIDAILTYSF